LKEESDRRKKVTGKKVTEGRKRSKEGSDRRKEEIEGRK
jgi:hypothetical protein